MESASFSQLIRKLDEFIRKYYTNQLVRGLIYSIGGLVLFFLLTTFIEYFGRLGTLGRAVLFYGYVLAAGMVVFRLVLVPLFHLYRLGKIISYDQAADIIGKHFGDVRDKLTNTLQLQRLMIQGSDNTSLIAASIDQRIRELRPIPFTAAVDIRQNRKYARYALVPLTILLLLLFLYPSFLTDSSKRIIQYNTVFEPMAPFSFVIANDHLETPAQQDFTLQVTITGSEWPEQVYVDMGGSKFRLDKEDKQHFSYTFRNVQRSFDFRLYADGFYSRPYDLKALPNPVLVNFRIGLDYPAYTGKKDEFVSNTGDMVIPAGTKATWEFSTRNTDRLLLQFSDSTYTIQENGDGMYTHTARFLRENRYRVITSNQYLKGKDQQVEYTISVIPDEYPSISVEEKQDSMFTSRLFFKGDIEDDYGFQQLEFTYRHYNGEKTIESQRLKVPFNAGFTRNVFFWNQDFSSLQLNPGDEIEYWFEVWDNDGVSGSKSARSQKKLFRVPTLNEIEKQQEQNNEGMKSGLKEAMKDAARLQKELDELNRRLLEKKDISWQDKKKMQDLMEMHRQLQDQVENLKKENEQNNTRNEEFRKSDERILEKQRELEKLFENILSDEMKEKLKELERMMENLDKNKLRDMVDQMKLDNKDIEKELDRSLELFKKLEFEQKLENTIQKLDRLKEKQEKLSEQSNQKNTDTEKLKEQQDQLNKEFEDVRKDLDDLEKKNQALEDPMNMQDTEKQEQDIRQDQQNSSQELQQNKPGKASKSQKSAAQKMEQMSEQLKQMQAAMESESMEEDIGKLREILENLLQLSFNQEQLMKQLYKTQPNNPLYITITAEQKRIKDDAKMIEDSLFALSKRIAQLQSFVNREISSINMNLDKAVAYLAERQSNPAASRQQHVMTSINNLALMLSEVTNQMQQQMAQQKPGNGSCSKPGSKPKPGSSGKPSLGTMRQLQEQLNEQLKQMKEGMNKPGGMKGKQSSEQLARMAAQQEMLRNELQKMMNEMMKEGNGNSGNLRNIANKMEQTETDIVNKNVTAETIRRQQEIMTRLLEAENAEREREFDNKRESSENKSDQQRNISAFDQYNRLMKQEAELLKTIPPGLKPFYRNMVKEYFSTMH